MSNKLFFLIRIITVLLAIGVWSYCGNSGGGGGDNNGENGESNSAGDVETETVGGVSFNMIYVPAKTTFTDTTDLSEATVTSAYEIADTEVTYELWSTVYTWATVGDGAPVSTGEGAYFFSNAGTMGDNGARTNQHPVTTINWRDAMVWTNALTEYYNAQNGASLEVVYYSDGDSSYTTPFRDSRDPVATCATAATSVNAGDCDNPDVKSNADGFRLPTADEWELAARYITDSNSDGDIKDTGEFYPGNYASGATLATTDFTATDLVAWFGNNTPTTGNTTTTQPVSTKTANALGLYDMSGNVWEWIYAWYNATVRSVRGGSWFFSATNLQVGLLSGYLPYLEFEHIGFRPARNF